MKPTCTFWQHKDKFGGCEDKNESPEEPLWHKCNRIYMWHLWHFRLVIPNNNVVAQFNVICVSIPTIPPLRLSNTQKQIWIDSKTIDVFPMTKSYDTTLHCMSTKCKETIDHVHVTQQTKLHFLLSWWSQFGLLLVRLFFLSLRSY